MNFQNNQELNTINGMPVQKKGVNLMTQNVSNPYSERYKKNKTGAQKSENPVITGYFVKEKSYKEIIIARINTTLCCILGFLVFVCLVSYYFVVVNEIKLQKISKETISLNYENADMQNKLDNLQSYSNVDFEVTKANLLQRAEQVIELSAADLPVVNYDNTASDSTMNWSLGY